MAMLIDNNKSQSNYVNNSAFPIVAFTNNKLGGVPYGVLRFEFLKVMW